jgi:hypothetical protein
VPEFLPTQHEPSHVQIAEQRTDRRPLWSTSTFVPIARTPTFVPTLVGFLDRKTGSMSAIYQQSCSRKCVIVQCPASGPNVKWNDYWYTTAASS